VPLHILGLPAQRQFVSAMGHAPELLTQRNELLTQRKLVSVDCHAHLASYAAQVWLLTQRKFV